MTFTTRFAPSPTGPLHLGHAYSALLAHDMARQAGGRFLLRIDDLDQSRSRPEWEAQLKGDLAWLGLTWPEPCRRQSEHLPDYRAALERLSAKGLTYPCRCSRRDIASAASAPQEGAAHFGPDGLIYPGTCRGRAMSEAEPGDAIRLDIQKALGEGSLPGFTETGAAHAGQHLLTPDYLLTGIGDPVLARPHMGASYHLSVVVDDAAQGVTDVIRGEDLFTATFLHRFLQMLLELPVPRYHHHPLVRDEAGKRLAKRDDARAIARYRDDGLSPDAIRRKVGL
ncbi:tRNA glutamyl-Q(34) synthetase GluQRS [Oceanicola sp. D3]|uniref:tRNA glutamyl-Q(34) synthetase GluQRS n=1 Tax=Oceanicola sp. D3 TaxID=2587163 RepID=UPI00111E0183|nr:tRNA glutamyl-Q(34) synthetase GluQRS [Oceanicola sp. D3]QDC09574.1 tRNA glutamyl-Q(34) synthetase GluQRS [Oceanicola sp. D3]